MNEGGKYLKKLCCCIGGGGGVFQDNLVLAIKLYIGPYEDFPKLTFWVLTLGQSQWQRANRTGKGLMIELTALDTLYNHQFKLSSQLIKPLFIE